MEKSIKRVERLVHATNSALAQMKLSLMFDDMNSEERENFRRTEGFHPTPGDMFLEGDDLKQCQEEFKTEASEMFAKIEKMFGSKELSRRNSQVLDRIKEINRGMKTPTLEQPEFGETQQSRQKLLSLIGEEKFSPGVASSKGSAGSKRGVPLVPTEKKPTEKVCCAPKKAEPLPEATKTRITSKEELKSNILETQEIVDRGFQTARQLAHKVDSITKCERKEKTPENAASEIFLKGSEEMCESKEDLVTVKCERHSGKEKKRKRDGAQVERHVNARVIDVTRRELDRSGKSNLQVQRLPSVNIKGALQLQKIHNLEISTAADAGGEKSNTGVAFFSHEQIEKEKIDKIVEKMRKENCCCTEGDYPGNYVECYHCGKLIRIRKARVDPRKVDEILQKCNFNVFDPRIEEFVENYGTVDAVSCCEQTPLPDPAEISPPAAVEPEVKINEPNVKPKTENKQPKRTKADRRFTLQSLSDQLYKKYRQEADTLEGIHLKVDSILQNLFRKVDESREVFEKCCLLKSRQLDSEWASNLTATKPALISFAGDSLRTIKKRRRSYRADIQNLNRDKSESPEMKVEWPREPSHLIKSLETDKTKGGTSLISTNRGGSAESEAKKNVEEKLVAAPTEPSPTTKRPETRKPEGHEGSACALLPGTSVDREPNNPNTASRKQNAAITVKPSLWNSGQGDAVIGLLATPATDKGKTPELPETKKQEVEEKNNSNAPSASPVPGETAGRVASADAPFEEPENASHSAVMSVILKPISALRNEGSDRKTLLPSPGEGMDSLCQGKAPSEGTSERSENYESDFESMTNDPEEHGDDCEGEGGEETEMFPLFNKLSTISEVDSEIEKKLGDEAKPSERNILERNPRDDGLFKQEGSSDRTRASPSSKRQIVVPKVSPESSPRELVNSLKDILSELRSQFARTESLAEKLTENQKIETKGNAEPSCTAAEGPVVGQWEIPADANLVENLQSARKGNGGASRVSRAPVSLERATTDRGQKAVESLSEEGGSSLGEVVLSERTRRNSGKSDGSSVSESSFLKLTSARRPSRSPSVRKEVGNTFGFKIGVSSEDASYSEGEIPSENLLNVDGFSIHSVGEISH